MTQKKEKKKRKEGCGEKKGARERWGVKGPEERGTGRKGHKKAEAEVGDPVGT